MLIKKSLVVFMHDLVMLVLSFVLSLWIRMGTEDALALYVSGKLDSALILFIAFGSVVFWFCGLYRGIWRYASITELTTIFKSVSLLLIIYIPVLFLVNRLEEMPRSTILINWFVLVFLLGGPRLLFRLYKDGLLVSRFSFSSFNHPGEPVVLVGTTGQGESFIRAMCRDKKAPYHILALLDFSPEPAGRKLHGLTIDYAQPEKFGAILDNIFPMPAKVILSRPESRETMQILREQTKSRGISLERLPRDMTLDPDQGVVHKIQPIAIEDILGRQQIQLNHNAIQQMIEGKKILVTGAGGSIGAELVRQVVAMHPARLVLVENGEYNLYAIDRELGHLGTEHEAILCDVRNRTRIEEVIATFKPDVVFHAAALKHVPMVEANPLEGLETNVIGTQNVADACLNNDVKTMVLISTDKAINPPNIMGASKRLAEIYCQSLDIHHNKKGTRFVTVRFGNVLGSTGSVVPLFKKQLEQGGPLTVTHPEITRYFMSIREAVELVLQSATMEMTDKTGHLGQIYVLEMGDPVRIVDLAKDMIRLGGFQPDRDIQIEFTGLRAGEKLYEELFYSDEKLYPTGHDSLQRAAPRVLDTKTVQAKMAKMKIAISANQTKDAIAILAELVPEYSGSGAEPHSPDESSE